MSGAQRDEKMNAPPEEACTPEEHADNNSLPDSENEAKVEQGEADGIVVSFSGRTDVGLVREHNEDNLVIADLTEGKLFPRNEHCVSTVGERGTIFAVCDGMGGAAAGEVASQMGVDILFDSLREGDLPVDRDVVARRLVAAVEQAGKRIYETAQSDTTRRGMGTTVTATVLIDKVLFAAQIGDSRAYLLRLGEFKQITKDQSLVSQLIEAGHLTEKEAETFEHSNIILQALGTSETVQVDLSFAELRKGDRLIVCSDGLSGMVDNELIKETLVECENPDECCKKLIAHANAAGGHDNITVIVVDFDGDILDHPKSADSFGYIEYPLMPDLPDPIHYDDGSSEEITVATNRPPARLKRDSKFPTSQPPPKKKSHLWVYVGILALIGAGLSLQFTDFQNKKNESIGPEHEVHPADEQSDQNTEKKQTLEDRPASENSQAVKVSVSSDVENADLHINGESRGPLSTEEATTIELPPGAYRFEALTDGNVAAVVVATVRPNVPLEVSLTLPNGTADPFSSKKADKKLKRKLRKESSTTAEEGVSPEKKKLPPTRTSSLRPVDRQSETNKDIIDKSKATKQPTGQNTKEKSVVSIQDSNKASEPSISQQKSPHKKEPVSGESTVKVPSTTQPGSDQIPENPF